MTGTKELTGDKKKDDKKEIKKKKEYAERKGTVRIVINSFLNAFCIALLAFFLNNPRENKSNEIVIYLLVMSIPILFTSSLFYTKVAYREVREYYWWNKAAWLTHTIGYFALINAIFLTIYLYSYKWPALAFIIITMLLTLVYSMIDVILDFRRIWEKLWKQSFYLLLIYFGSLKYVDVGIIIPKVHRLPILLILTALLIWASVMSLKREKIVF